MEIHTSIRVSSLLWDRLKALKSPLQRRLLKIISQSELIRIILFHGVKALEKDLKKNPDPPNSILMTKEDWENTQKKNNL